MEDFNKLYSDLTAILEKMIAIHRTLIEVLNGEHAAMITMNTKELFELTHTKQILLSEIKNYELSRITCIEKITPEKNVTIEQVAKRFNEEKSKNILMLKDVLTLLIKQAKEQNTINKSFAEISLVRIEQLKRNVLGISNNEKKNYSNSGSHQPSTDDRPKGGRLVSTEA